MAAAGRTIAIVVVVIVALLGAGYFFGPKTASRSETLEISAPPQTVLARLSSTPVGSPVVEGVTVAEAATLDGDTVSAPVTFSDGATGRVVYRVTPRGEGSQVRVSLEQNLGGNPLDRLQVFTGGDVAPLIATAAAAVQNDLGALPSASFANLQYSVVDVTARPFFYVENCSGSDTESITSIIGQAVVAIPPVMRANNLSVNGQLMAVEPRVVSDQYCYQVGYPYSGRQPRALLIGRTGQTPAGTALRVVYTGTEDDVMAQVYDPMDALLAAAYLDNPATREDDWVTYEVYHDDPTQAGGSRNREIFYVTQGDISALTRIHAPTDAVAVPANAPPPAETPETPETPAETPEPATP